MTTETLKEQLDRLSTAATQEAADLESYVGSLEKLTPKLNAYFYVLAHAYQSGSLIPRPAATPDVVLIWSGEHHAYWRPNSAGYCTDGLGAGLYSRAEAERIVRGCDAEKKVQIREIPTDAPIIRDLLAKLETARDDAIEAVAIKVDEHDPLFSDRVVRALKGASHDA
ncbi:hypothetical protein ACSMXM_05715 [Pacificimonas sp. ICDLI1SI03]